MSGVKSIKKNYLYNLAFQILSIILPIITTPYLSRVLGADGIGTSSFTLSIVAYFILFANLGIAAFGQREIAMYQNDKKKYSKVFWDLFAYRLMIGLVSVCAYLIFIIYFPTNYQVIYIILLLNLLANIFDISWFYQGLEEYKTVSVRNIIVKLAFAISIFVFVKNPEDLNLYILLNGLSQFVSTTILWVSLPKLVEKPVMKKIKVFHYWKDTLVYFLPQIATTIYTVLDKTMLGVMSVTQVENGYYEQSYKVVSIALTTVTSLNAVLLPRMSLLYKQNNIKEIKERLEKSFRFISFLAIPLAFGIAAISCNLVPWFFGAGYEKVIILLPVFAPIIISISFSNCLGNQCLTPCGMRLQSAKALWVGAGLNLVGNIILIPMLGSIGAAISSVAAETVIMVLYFRLARKYIKSSVVIKNAVKNLIAGSIMFVVVFILSKVAPATIISSIWIILTGVAVYDISLLLLRDSYFLDLLNEALAKARELLKKQKSV